MVFCTGSDGCGCGCVELGCKLCALWRLLFDLQGHVGGWERFMAICSSGLGSPGCCSEMRFPAWWKDCMKKCSNGVNREGCLRGLRRVIVFSMGPYSCWLLRMWRAYADWGLLLLIINKTLYWSEPVHTEQKAFLISSWNLCTGDTHADTQDTGSNQGCTGHMFVQQSCTGKYTFLKHHIW